VIGGRVLDASAILAFSTGRSIYAAALVWTAVEEGIVLVLPSTAVATAWAQLPEKAHSVLEVLLQLPVTLVDDLTATRARTVGVRGGDQLHAHSLLCAHERGWALVTESSGQYTGVDRSGVEIEQLP
jgi:hypothetical protein